MPLAIKYFLYAIVFFHILLNVTIINSAVIRREQRSITTDNGTVSAISADKELEPATAIGLGDDGNLLLETLSVAKDDTTTKNLPQDTTTTTFGEENKGDTTLTDLKLDENTVSLSSDGDRKSSKIVIEDGNKKDFVKTKTQEATTEEFEDKSTITTLKEITTITPVTEDDKTTSTSKLIEEKETSTVLFETTAQLESSDSSNNKTDKEEDIGTTHENLVEVTTQIVPISFKETTNVRTTDPTTSINETTATEVASTTNVDENDSTRSPIHSPTTKEIDEKVTEPFNAQNVFIETSTELTDNDISKTFATNEQKTNMILEKEVTTESVFLAYDENVDKRKPQYETFTRPKETTELSTSTENSEEHTTVTMTVLQDYKPTNDTKNSNSSSTEKRGKFIAHNYSTFNDFHLPNTSDVWALASLRSVGKSKSSELQNSVETSEEKPVNNSVVAKSLHDWTRVMDTTHDIEPKPSFKILQHIEDSTTEITTSITGATSRDIEDNSTLKPIIDMTTDITTEMPIQQEAIESRSNQDNEVELSTVKFETTTVIAATLSDKIEKETITNPTESQNVDNYFETTTDKYENSDQITTENNPPKDTEDIHLTTTATNSLHALNNHNKTIEENKVDGDSFEKEIITLPTTITTTTTTTTATTTTTETPIPQIVTVKIETTDSLVNGEITQEANAGTTSLSTSSSLSDFTTSMPFLTTTDAITKAPIVAMTDVQTTTPPVIFHTENEENEPPSNTDPSKVPTQSTSPVAMTMDSSAATTTTTTIPAVTAATQAITTETQTTEAPHTPAIISNETMIQKSNNNYNEYEVVSKSTENYTDNSSTEAFEATTRVGLHHLNWSTNIANIPTTEVDKLNDDLDVTTVSSFETNNNAYEINSTESTTTAISTVKLVPKTYPIVTEATTDVTKLSSSTEHLDHIDPIRKISDTAEASIESNVIDPLQVGDTSTAATTTTTSTENDQENMKMPSTDRGDDDSVYLITTTTTTTTERTTTTSTSNYDDSATTFESISTKKEDVYSIVPTIDNGEGGGFNVPKLVLDDTTTLMPPGEIGVAGVGVGGSVLQPMDSPEAQETDVNVIIAISVSTVGIIALILLVAFLYVMRKRQKQMSYGQRCRPVSLDAYSLDNVSVYNSVRRKGATLRASKRSYGNVAFDDPSLRHNVLGTHELARYVEKKSSIWEEFKEVPQIIARADEVPAGCEDKNRYANVIPLPETRVILQQQNGDEKSEYINANYVRGPKDTTNYYIACQAPLETTVNEFWRMIWEQNSRVIIMATDLIENGIDKCAEYLPPSVTLDNHTVFGDYQVTLKHREVKEKYAISTLMLKNTDGNNESREITHYWYQWPETGVPTDEAAIIAMLLEARSSLKAYTIEQSDIKIENVTVEDNSSVKIEINGNVASEKQKTPTKDQGPLTIHCSPGTGRTGTILACDIAMRCLEEPKRTVDIPQIVYSVRRGRASAVQTKEQYEFIYKVTHMYATKISNINNDN